MFVLTYRQFPNVGLWFEHPYRRRDAWREVPNLAMGVSRPLEVESVGNDDAEEKRSERKGHRHHSQFPERYPERWFVRSHHNLLVYHQSPL